MNTRTKFEPFALEGVYLQSLQHGVYEVLVMDDDDVPRILKSLHVTFDESSFPGAPYPDNYMEHDSASDDDYSCSTNLQSESESSNSAAVDDVLESE